MDTAVHESVMLLACALYFRIGLLCAKELLKYPEIRRLIELEVASGAGA